MIFQLCIPWITYNLGCIQYRFYWLKYFEKTVKQRFDNIRGVIRKFAENSCHFYIVWSIELELQHVILQHKCSWPVTTCLMLVVYKRYSCRQNNATCRTGPFYVAFWRFTTQPIKLQRFVKFYYAVIYHIAYHAYLTTYLLLFYANFQRF